MQGYLSGLPPCRRQRTEENRPWISCRPAEQQNVLFDEVNPWLSGGKPPKGVPPAFGHAEMVRMLAAFERLSPAQKQVAAEHWRRHFKKVSSYWALGRLYAREPLFGEASNVVAPEVAAAALETLFELDWKGADGAAFAALLLARVTGDPARDLPEALRKRVRSRLRDIDAPAPWLEMLTQRARLSESDAKRSYGEALPPGLRLG
jgi:hypothetical protein